MFTLKSNDGAAVFESGDRHLRVAFPAAEIARVTYTEGKEFSDNPSRIVSYKSLLVAFDVREEGETFVLAASGLTVVLNKLTGALSYMDSSGRMLMREPERGGRWLTAKEVNRNIFDKSAGVASAQSIDGARAEAKKYESVFDRMAFEAKLEFVFSEGEALFGFGSHEEGYGNLRGRSRELYQQNMKAVVPYFVSTRGYGVLFDCGSLMTFHDDAYGSYWWADIVDELDFYVIRGECFDDVTRGYHRLTGKAPMLPKWAFGYVQSKERYVNAAEMIDVVREYRRRKVPLDAIVLDWKSWPNGAGWGQKSFDPLRFPEPEAFTSELHAMGARLMVSIWPIMTGGCENQREMLDHDMMLGNQATYNAFDAEARECYWEQARRGLFSKGIDAWWCDCTEPFEADWTGAVKPEPHMRLALNTQESKLYIDAGEINAYSLAHSQGIYEGQRRTTSAKRVVNLTRSAYAGQHRYGTITWNGDICATWETLRRCIPEGLNFCAAGEPYWTVDVGGFFIANDKKLWFWRGDYSDGCRGLTDMNALEPDTNDAGCRDLGYWELYVRWMQYAVFLPMLRSHGTDAAREIWRFGEEGTRFYDAIARYIRLRYQLMPYIYSTAAQVTLNSESMIRAVALDFPSDTATHNLTDQYMFGPAFMVCPVTAPMYYTSGSRELSGVAAFRDVYLPAGHRWFDFWTDALHQGGKVIAAEAPLETIPLYVRAGSIVPMTEVMQFTDEVLDAPYEIRVYTGADAAFTLYEDAGDGYDYERGECALVKMRWDEKAGELILSAREGTFPKLVVEREYDVVFISETNRDLQSVRYRGQELLIKKNSK
jgi:alpha-D-xyloside xylohydrolase